MASAIEKAARDLAEAASLGTYNDDHIKAIMDAVKNADEDPDNRNDLYREAAKRKHEVEGQIEFDSDAIVSRSDDGGAYVQAWTWVYDDDADDVKED